MRKKAKDNTICLKCGNTWPSKWDKVKMPYRAQCPNCLGYTIVLIEQYKRDIEYLRKLLTPEEIKKFSKFYDWAIKNGYVGKPSSREAKLKKLLDDSLKQKIAISDK